MINAPINIKLYPEKPLPEYPRPQMVREGWHNLKCTDEATTQPTYKP